MLYEFIEYEHRLAQNQVLSLRSTSGDLVVCEQGDLWLTEEGGPDVFLTAGEKHRVRSNGRLLIESFQAARLQYLPKEAAGITMTWRKHVALLARQINVAVHRVLPQLVKPSAHRSQSHRSKASSGAPCECA